MKTNYTLITLLGRGADHATVAFNVKRFIALKSSVRVLAHNSNPANFKIRTIDYTELVNFCAKNSIPIQVISE